MIASRGSSNSGLIPPVGLLFPAILMVSIWLEGAHCQAQDTSTQGAAAQATSRFAGPTDSGFLLPNGWHLTPAGKQVDTSDLLLNIFPMKDSRRAVIATSGFNEHQLGIVDLDSGEFLSKQVVHQSWFGLAVAPDESRLWWSGGGFGRVIRLQRRRAERRSRIVRYFVRAITSQRLITEECRSLRRGGLRSF